MAMAMARKGDPSPFRRVSDGSTKLSMIVGENVRHLRRRQGLSLEQLAAISGVSRAMLGQIETGKSAPTINLLGRIAEALKVSIAGIISAPGAGSSMVVPRDRATIVASSEGGFVSRALFPWGDPLPVEIYEVTVAASHTEVFPAAAPGTKKSLVVISGQLEVVVADETPERLANGDTILFNADNAHQISNPGGNETKAFLVVTSADANLSRARQA